MLETDAPAPPPTGERSDAGGEVACSTDEVLLSPALGVEQCDAAAVTIYLTSSGARLRVPRALYDAMLAFELPRTIASVTYGDARLARAIERLRALGFLVGKTEAAAPPPPRPVTDPPLRLFDCPAHKLSGGGADVVVIGVPYDGGDHDAAGARHGPAALRQTSLQLLYGLDRRTGQPLGWFDADLGRPILRGVTIGDAGDVLVTSGEPQDRTFARLRDVLDTLMGDQRRLCALLGGDATISFPLVDAMQARGPLGIVRFGNIERGVSAARSAFLSPSTLPGRALALPNVDSFVQIGAGACADDAPLGFAMVAPSQLADRGIAAIAPYLAAGRTLHLGLDVAALATPFDPTGARSDRECFAYPDLRALLHAIGERYRIVSIDLVGINPMKRNWGVASVAAVHLLLAMLSAATDRHGRAGAA